MARGRATERTAKEERDTDTKARVKLTQAITTTITYHQVKSLEKDQTACPMIGIMFGSEEYYD